MKKELSLFAKSLVFLIAIYGGIYSSLILAEDVVINVSTDHNNNSVILPQNSSGEAGHHKHIFTFESGEHLLLGDSVTILFPVAKKNLDGTVTYEYVKVRGDANFAPWLFSKHPLRNQLTYGSIVAMPDLYADPDHVISEGTTPEEQRERFKKAFNKFHEDGLLHLLSLDGVLDDIIKEKEHILGAMDRHEEPSVHYSGGWVSAVKTILKDKQELDILLKGMIDHFGGTSDHDLAWIAYKAGHEVAEQTAIAAHKATGTEKSRLLVLAYAMNAYACHYLTDRFAAGHIRIPYKELQKAISINTLALLLVNKQHDEDNALGLSVTNKRGDKWQAYGDKRCYDDVNAHNRNIIAEAMQKSADEITYAFNNGATTSLGLEQIIIDIDALMNFHDYVNNVDRNIPLFAYDVKTKELLRRDNIKNLHPSPHDLPFDHAKMRPYGRLIYGWFALPTLLELVIKNAINENGLMTMPNQATNSYVNEDGQLNDHGKQVLGAAISEQEGLDKFVICNSTIKFF